MPTVVTGEILTKLQTLIHSPSLAHSRALEDELMKAGYERMVFGRVNQRSSVEANSESDRGIAERLANAFDATLTAARLAAGIPKSDRSLTPRNAAERFICPNKERCEWAPTHNIINFFQPAIEFVDELTTEKHRYRKHHPDDGLVTVIVRDFGTGIDRERMPKTILDLNSDDKLKTFEAIGQFGHGGSSSLSFCESALVISQPRFTQELEHGHAYWTLIYPEPEAEASKQELLRRWFADHDKLPLILRTADIPELRTILPGTAIWHFGYHRGGWIKRIAGPEQTNPWGRLSRLFFSYPLPFDITGKFARTDTETGSRSLKGSFFRLMKDDSETIDLTPTEKSDSLIVSGIRYGTFSMFPFVLKDRSRVRDYVDPRHPIILTLNGQNHGELTANVLAQAKYPELSASTIVEIRLDNLDQEAQGNIINNSRERPKNTDFTRQLEKRVTDLLENDEALREIERKRQEEKAKKSNAELNKTIQTFLSTILSDAMAEPTVSGGGTGPGESTSGGGKPRPEIAAADPPFILQFLSDSIFYVAEGSSHLAKFKSDARPPKYSFHGDNQRFFTQLEVQEPWMSRFIVAGMSDVNAKGYGAISLSCIADSEAPILEAMDIGWLIVRLQTTDRGRVLEAKLRVGVAPKPSKQERKREREAKLRITFHAPGGDASGELARLIGETSVLELGTQLSRFKDDLSLATEEECAYMGAKGEEGGVSTLLVEINVGNPELKHLLEGCKTIDERIAAKERYCKDVVLDCYQHHFTLDDIPDEVSSAMAQSDDGARAAEIYLNHDKAIRFAIHERNKDRAK